MKKIIILDNIRSAHNVGAIFRTADGAGVAKIYLCGYTPAPIDRFGRVRPEIAKTSLSATTSIEWEAVEKIEDLLDCLKAEGVAIAAVEQCSESVSYKDWEPAEITAFIFGNEVEGVQEAALQKADTILEIKMHGKKESLNVSTTVGVILFHYT